MVKNECNKPKGTNTQWIKTDSDSKEANIRSRALFSVWTMQHTLLNRYKPPHRLRRSNNVNTMLAPFEYSVASPTAFYTFKKVFLFRWIEFISTRERCQCIESTNEVIDHSANVFQFPDSVINSPDRHSMPRLIMLWIFNCNQLRSNELNGKYNIRSQLPLNYQFIGNPNFVHCSLALTAFHRKTKYDRIDVDFERKTIKFPFQQTKYEQFLSLLFVILTAVCRLFDIPSQSFSCENLTAYLRYVACNEQIFVNVRNAHDSLDTIYRVSREHTWNGYQKWTMHIHRAFSATHARVFQWASNPNNNYVIMINN